MGFYEKYYEWDKKELAADNETTGMKLAALREKADISQETFAEMLGVSRPTVQRWEWGESEPGFQHMLRAAEILGVSPSYFFPEHYNFPENKSRDIVDDKELNAVIQQMAHLINQKIR